MRFPGPAHAGVMTRGITDPHTYYYRRLITDAVLAVGSQGGGPFHTATQLTWLPHHVGAERSRGAAN